jgi:hypothetical protein
MIKKRFGALFLLAGVFVFFCAGFVRAEDFSADMINTVKGKVMKGKIFISKDKMRMESQEAITITRMDKKIVWILMPKDKMYMEQAFDPAKAVSTAAKVSGEIERKQIGQEMIDGKMADKFQVVYSLGKKKETIFQWIVAGAGIPVKTAAADNSWSTEYKNIKKSRQPDDLFEVPAGYQPFSFQKPSMKDVFKGLVR